MKRLKNNSVLSLFVSKSYLRTNPGSSTVLPMSSTSQKSSMARNLILGM